MGTDIRLKLKNLEIDGDLAMANLGRKWPLTEDGGKIETEQAKLWNRVTEIEKDLAKSVATYLAYTPKSYKEIDIMMHQVESDLAGIVEELVNYGRKILLANILHDSAGFLYLEDC